MRAAGLVALRRARARSNLAPLGLAQSIGTLSVPQSAVGSSSHGAQATVLPVLAGGAALAVDPDTTTAVMVAPTARSLIVVLTRSSRRNVIAAGARACGAPPRTAPTRPGL